MKYNDSVSDFFKSPKWLANMMLGAVALLIPVVGQIVLAGWHVTLFWARDDEDKPADYPPFDFQYFGKYLERGLWPFLVNLVGSVILVPVIMCMVIPLLFFAGIFESPHGHDPGLGFVLVFVGIIFLQMSLMLAYQIIITPLIIRADITQEFGAAFHLGFLKDFLSRMWKELAASMLFMFGLGLCMMVLAVITCYIGAFFAAPVVMFSWHHLQKQLYQIYLERGGEPVPLSPKLHDLPPALPGM